MIKTIISDLGNVLLHFNHNISCNKIAQICGCKEEDVYGFIYHSKIDIKFDRGEVLPEEFFKQLKNQFNLSMSFKDFKLIFADIFSLNKPVCDLLTKLKPKYKLCLISNTNVLHYEFCEKKFDILKIFNHKILSYKMHVMKPHPKIYLKAVKLCNVLNEECVYIDDILEFVEAANYLGIHGIHYKSMEYLQEELKKLSVL